MLQQWKTISFGSTFKVEQLVYVVKENFELQFLVFYILK